MGCASSSPVPPAAAHNDKLSKEADGSGGSSVASEPAGKHVVNTQKGLRDSALMEQTRSMEGTKGEDAGARSRATIKTPAGAEDGASIPENGEALLQGGKGPARASGEPPRKSRDSVASSPAVRGSTRSSFAADAVLLNTAGRQGQGDGLGPMAGRNKATAERLAGQPDASGLSGQYVPAALERPFSRLVVVPPDTPVPTSMLQNLWQLASLSQVTAVVTALQTQGVLRVATLDDMSVWCLVSGATLEHLQHKYVAQTSYFHALLLDSYSRNCTSGSGRQSGSGALQVRDIPDDGYIMQNIAHHLLGCGRLNTLRSLLGEPAWLEAKLHAYGTAPVVADFRRYLAEEPEDTGVRLLLQAFQLSLGCCAEQPGVHMLREQMLSRLITAAHMQPGAPVLRSPSGGAALTARRTDSARAERESQSGVAELDAAGKAVSLSTEQAILTTRDSARYSDASNSLREWFEGQSSHAAMDIITSAGRSCVHLLPRSASLKQAGGLQRMILRGHAGPIHKVVISPNGQDVVTVSADGSAQVWDMNVGDCVMQLARQQALSDVDVAPDGCLCVVASVDGAACVWDLATGKVKHVLKGHTAKINSVAIDKAGKRCVTASDDRSVRLWDIEKGTCQAVLAGHGHSHAATGRSGASGEFGLVFDVALSSDGSFAATASEDFTARVWDLDEAKCEHVLEGHTGWVVAVQFLGDTTHVITASHDNTARVWDGIRGCCLHILTGHTGRLSSVCVDAAGQLAVTSSDDGTARIWEIESGKCRHVLERHVAWVADAAITRDGSRCVTVGGDALVCVWNCATGELQATLEGHSAALRSVVLSGGGRFAVTAGEDCTACVWDLGVKGTCAHPQQHGHRAKIMAVRTLAGRRQVVTSCEDGEVLLWDVSDCKPMRALQGHMVAAAKHLGVSADGSRVLAGTANRHVCCWDAATGALLSSLPAQQGSRVKEMAFSRSGTYVATVLFDSQTAVYDITTGKVVAQLIGRGERVGRNVHTGGVNGILLCGANGGTETAITWSKDCTARIWDIATNTMRSVCEGHTDGIRCAAISTDEVLLATASYAPCVRLHMVEDGSPVAVLDHATAAVQVAFSPDGNLLAVALENHTVVIWDLVAHSCLNPIVAHKNDIMDLVFSPDSLLLVTCSQDCSVRVWDARTGGPIAFFVADSALMACSFAGGEPGGVADILVAADAGGATHFLDLPQELQPGGTGLVLR